MRTLIGSLLAAVAFFPASALAQQVDRRADEPAGERAPPSPQRRMSDGERFGPRPDRAPEAWQRAPRPEQARPEQARPDQVRDDPPRPALVQMAPRPERGPDRTEADRDADRRADDWRRGPEQRPNREVDRGPDRGPPPGPDPRFDQRPDWAAGGPRPDRTQADRDADRSADRWRRNEQRRAIDRDRRDRDRDFQARTDWARRRAYEPGFGGNWGNGSGWGGNWANGGWAGDRDGMAEWNSGRDGYRPRAWDRGWRTDRRFDFDAFRQDNRQAFHLPRYYGPSGWTQGYRRFGLGISLAPSLWNQSYWIADPWAYRLPEAYGPYRWVRYYGDALLVDLRSGQVVDAVYDLFW